MSALGFAVERDGQIDVATVSPTELAAKVNGLVTIFNTYPTRGSPDAWINALWLDAVKDLTSPPLIIPVIIKQVDS